MTAVPDGRTRLVPIVGDPIAQVRSPGGVTEVFAQRGANILCVPAHVVPADFGVFMAAMRATRNVDGIIITIPHKFAAFEACDTVSECARFLRSVNTIRRNAAGTLHGDMFDGLACVTACKEQGCVFDGRRALLVGAGGAGTAIAHAAATAGLTALGIADLDSTRRDTLVARLAGAGLPVHPATPDPAGYDIVLNATPLGMRASDPLPVREAALSPHMFVGDVVTEPELPPLILAARRAGCKTSTGTGMFLKVRDLMVDFLLGPPDQT